MLLRKSKTNGIHLKTNDMRSEADILRDVKLLAIEYYEKTGKPLGVTGEIAELEASLALGLTLAGARQEGYDALRQRDGITETIQIKGRWKKEGTNWGRVPSIKTDKEFDTAMLVLLTGRYDLHEIWEAPRAAVIARLDAPGSKARNERRSMGVSQFKAIAKRTWSSR